MAKLSVDQSVEIASSANVAAERYKELGNLPAGIGRQMDFLSAQLRKLNGGDVLKVGAAEKIDALLAEMDSGTSKNEYPAHREALIRLKELADPFVKVRELAARPFSAEGNSPISITVQIDSQIRKIVAAAQVCGIDVSHELSDIQSAFSKRAYVAFIEEAEVLALTPFGETLGWDAPVILCNQINSSLRSAVDHASQAGVDTRARVESVIEYFNERLEQGGQDYKISYPRPLEFREDLVSYFDRFELLENENFLPKNIIPKHEFKTIISKFELGLTDLLSRENLPKDFEIKSLQNPSFFELSDPSRIKFAFFTPEERLKRFELLLAGASQVEVEGGGAKATIQVLPDRQGILFIDRTLVEEKKYGFTVNCEPLAPMAKSFPEFAKPEIDENLEAAMQGIFADQLLAKIIGERK